MEMVTKTRRINIQLRFYLGEWDGWGPDCFGELETDFSQNHERVKGDCAFIATEEEVVGLIEWWEQECRRANAGYNHDRYIDDSDYYKYGPEGDVLAALTDAERERGCEWALFVE